MGASTPASMTKLHLDTQALALVGGKSGELSDGNFAYTRPGDSLCPYPFPQDGDEYVAMAHWIFTLANMGIEDDSAPITDLEDTITTNPLNPYNTHEFFNPTAAGEPVYNMEQISKQMLDALRGYVPINYWKLASDTVKEELGAYIGEDVTIDDAYVDTYKDQVFDDVYQNIGDMNIMFANCNAVNSGARMMASANLIRSGLDKVEELRHRLRVTRRDKGGDTLVAGIQSILSARNDAERLKLAALASYGEMGKTYCDSKTNYFKEVTATKVEQMMWAPKLFDLFGKSIPYAQTTPAQPNKVLETVSVSAGIIASLVPGISALVGYLD